MKTKFVIACATACIAAAQVPAAEFTLSNIGAGRAYDINSSGLVALSVGGRPAVYEDGAVKHDIVPGWPPHPGACTAVSDAGWVGLSIAPDGSFPVSIAFNRDGGNQFSILQNEPAPPSAIAAINSTGRTAGTMLLNHDGFRYLCGVYASPQNQLTTELTGSSGLNDINEAGAMAGSLSTTGRQVADPWMLYGTHWHPRRACLVVNGQPQMIDQRPDPGYSQNVTDWYRDDWSDATRINTGNQVTGWFRTDLKGHRRAYFWEGNEMQDLGTLGGNESVALGLNDEGVVVGWANSALGAKRAFIWRAGVMIDLNDLVAPGLGWVLEEAVAINNIGQITGNGIYQGAAHAFLLNPEGQGEPPTIIEQPTGSGIYAIGSVLYLEVAANGDEPLTYQWLKSETELEGETAPTLQIESLQKTNAGNYRVRVSNAFGSVVSSIVKVEVPDALLDIVLYAGILIQGELGATYRLEYKLQVDDPAWTPLPDTVTITNNPQLYLDVSQPVSTRRIYQAVRTN